MTPCMVQILGVPSLCDLAPHTESPMTSHVQSVLYTLLEDYPREEKLEERTVFVTWRQNTVAYYIATWIIVEIYLWQHGQERE